MVDLDGNVPSGWAMVPIARVGSVRLGRQRSPDKQTGRYPTKYLRAANITAEGLDLNEILEMDFTPEERALFALRVGDVVLADSSGSAVHLGRSAIWSGDIPNCCYQNHVIRFRPHAARPRYAQLVFRYYAVSGKFAGIARGMGILHLGATRFASLLFPLPPLAEQDRIVSETDRRLDEIRSAETSLRSALGLIAEQRIAILAAAVAGELVEQGSEPSGSEGPALGEPNDDYAALIGRQPRLFGDDRGTATHSSVQATSPLPLGWKWARIDEVGEVKLGRQRSPDKHTGRFPTKYIRAANITPNGLDLRDVLEMDFNPEEREIFELRIGDVLLAEASGSAEQVGRPALWQGEIPSCCYQNTVIRFRPRAALSDFALLVFRNYVATSVFASVARGMGIQHLGASRLAVLPFPLPPLEEQRRIADEAGRRLETCDVQETAIRNSLDRLPLMEAEVLAAAAGGSLLPQDPTDEPAPHLLERLGEVPLDALAVDQVVRKFTGGKNVEARRRRTGSRDEPITDLAEVLRKADQALSLPELFVRADYDPDSVEQVEEFYIALRDQLGTSIHTFGSNTENAKVEAISDASR